MSTRASWRGNPEYRRLDDVFRTLGFTVGLEDVFTEAPRVGLYEDYEGLTLSMDVPGFTAESINIEVEGDHLTISGERKAESHEKTILDEQPFGKFRRSFLVSPHTHDLGRVEATVKDGVLTLRIPRHEETKPRQIKVKVTSA